MIYLSLLIFCFAKMCCNSVPMLEFQCCAASLEMGSSGAKPRFDVWEDGEEQDRKVGKGPLK